MKFHVIHTSGRGKGRRRLAENMPHLKSILANDPYPGTFNVVLDRPIGLVGGAALDPPRHRVGVVAFINGIACVAYRFMDAPLHIFELLSEFKLSDMLEMDALQLEIADEHLEEPSRVQRLAWNFYYRKNPAAYYDDRIYKRFMLRGSLHKLATQRRL